MYKNDRYKLCGIETNLSIDIKVIYKILKENEKNSICKNEDKKTRNIKFNN